MKAKRTLPMGELDRRGRGPGGVLLPSGPNYVGDVPAPRHGQRWLSGSRSRLASHARVSGGTVIRLRSRAARTSGLRHTGMFAGGFLRQSQTVDCESPTASAKDLTDPKALKTVST